MKSFLFVAILLFGLGSVTARSGPPDPAATRSFSGQFIAYPYGTSPSRFYLGNSNSIPLQPGLLVVSCERIKLALARMLDTNLTGRDRIFLHLRAGRFPREPATIAVQRVLNEWVYHIDLPDSLDSASFVRTLVQAILLEIANHNSRAQSAEIPLWLSEGLTQEMLATEKIGILLPENSTQRGGSLIKRLTIDERRPDPLQAPREILRERPPLTFEQMSWPTPQELSANEAPVFQNSAQLFVHQLLQTKTGPAGVLAMITELPQRLNWQFAFLDAFHLEFESLLNVEKWWALQLVEFTGRDLTQAWTAEESWNKLDAIVHFPVETRAQLGEMPRHTEISLQGVIQEFDGEQQRNIFRRKAQELDVLRPRVAQDLIGMVDDYRKVVGTYLEKQNFSGSFLWFKRKPGPLRNRLAEVTIQELNALDAKRRDLKSDPRIMLGSSSLTQTPAAR